MEKTKEDSALPATPPQHEEEKAEDRKEEEVVVESKSTEEKSAEKQPFADTLPLSAADGPIKTLFPRPLDHCKPPPPPELTSEQQTKYEAVLKAVSEWTSVPTTSAKNAPTEPITNDERMFLTRECLLRYLRATRWNVAHATQRLQATLTWRREYGVKEHTPEYISVENETGKQLILGYDNSGRPCLYLNPAQQNTEHSDRQIQHLVFMLERVLDLMGPDQESLALIVNFKQTRSGQSATLSQGRQTLHILQNHYPERLGRAMVINMPLVILGFMKLITPFIDPQTREKLKFNEDLRQHVPPAQLWKTVNGDVEFEYDHSLYWPALNALAAQRREEYRERWIKGGKLVGEHENYLKGGSGKCRAETEAATTGEITEKVEQLEVENAIVQPQTATA
ncbi:Phosphatidylinositol transfer protein (PITP) [Emydomyces testavorans]|uniref:Phosphatidylinositol transfer protein (PITP) n=1 Tax=Emydomyces testavorans TaxID=2070801 RepID=A0AAF0DLH9_9EURO|nr:Phosphatidylinositol transfer protein (PITP) [Emydomyces testavorans]